MVFDRWNTGKQEKDKFELQKAVNDEFSNMVLFKKFMFMCFDHIGFFLFSDHKLPRILGKKPGYLDKYMSVK